VHRYLLKTHHAGKAGYPPYAHKHHPAVSPKRLRSWASQKAVEIMYLKAYENDRRETIRARSRTAGFVADALISVGNGFVSSPLEGSDFFIVLRKTIPQSAK
jgi:hypothetical protein